MPEQPSTHAPQRIHLLPEVLINQIAAGEVVERPASILKELVENSLDAGATRVEVRLWQGGLEKIQILDNGSGMSEIDLSFCLTRHATSKISTPADLESIATFGFRGEALASIAAVSRIEIRSRLPELPTGFLVDADFGLMKAKPRPIACPAGTSITVEGLFEKLPARQKFMRSASTESAHCSRVLKEIAAGNAGTQFFLSNPERKVLEFVASTRAARFAECFRPAWEAMQVVEENEEARLEAFLVPPHVVQDRGDIWFYINQRPIRNRGLIAAVRQAYLSTLGPHHEPSGAVFLDVRRDWVDVNVHPQKTEVRCYRQESLFPWILSTIKKAIGNQRTLHSISHRSAESMYDNRLGAQPVGARPIGDSSIGAHPAGASPIGASSSSEDTLALDAPLRRAMHTVLPASAGAQSSTGAPSTTDVQSWTGAHSPAAEESPTLPGLPPHSPMPAFPTPRAQMLFQDSSTNEPRHTDSLSVDTPFANGSTFSTTSAPTVGAGNRWLRYLGQIKASYLICESDTGLVLVDQHALHEKVRTEELKKRFRADSLSVQKFLLPKVLPLPQDLLPIVEEHGAVLAKLGFEVELFGTAEAVLRSRPELIPEQECASLIEDVLREIASQRLKPEDVLNQSLHLLLATMACHSAIRANHLLSPLEAQTLLDKLDRLELGWTCPHGRPILFELSYSQIEHHFERA
jgi:DNA mismatch repair protein MutL